MFQTEYMTSFNHNYIKVKIDVQEREKPRYQYQILTTRKLEGLLPVSMHIANGEQGLYYEISSTQSLSKWFMKEKINRRWMDMLISALQVVLWSLEQYLLDNRNLVLHPDCIFQDMEKEKIRFLYCPYYVENEMPDMEAFLSFLVENADEREPETLEALYGIFSRWESMGEQFTVETFLDLWEKHVEESTLYVLDKEEVEETVLLPEEKENFVKQQENSRKKDIVEFLFGRHRRIKEAYSDCVAMERWEYQAETGTESRREVQQEEQEKTAYAEVGSETEERKLYGNGRQNRKVINLANLPVVIGKKDDMADVVLADVSVSGMHARLSEEDGQVYLEDLNATNGTYKNGVRLKPYEKVEILCEDEIKLGRLSFTYR